MQTSRRDVIKGALRTSAYAAPVVLAAVRPIPAAAQAVSAPRPTPTPTPTPAGVRSTVIPTIGPRYQLFSFAASGLTPNARYDVRRISGPGFPLFIVLGTVTATPGGAIGFSVFASFNNPTGVYVTGIAPAGTTTIVAQFTATVTPTGTTPTTPGILVSPTSGPAGTAFAFVAVGLTGNVPYDALLLSSPSGATGRIVTETTIVSGQFDFFFDSTAALAGTYTFGVARSGTATVEAQTSITVTALGSAAPASVTSGGTASGGQFSLGG